MVKKLLQLLLCLGMFAIPAAAQTEHGRLSVNDLLTFRESAGDATCAAGDYWLKGNSSTNTLRGCENGNLFDANTAAGSASWSSLTAPTAVTVFNSGAIAELFQLNFTANYGATDVLFDLKQLTGNPVAGSVLALFTATDPDLLPFAISDGTNNVFQVNRAGNVTIGGGAAATATISTNLSGATDPVVTLADGVFNLTTGTLQQSGDDVIHKGTNTLLSTENVILDGSTNPRDITLGIIRILQTPNIDSTRGVVIITDAAGFGDTKALDVDWTATGVVAGDFEAVIGIDIDTANSSGGNIIALEVTETATGSATAYGMLTGVGVNPILNKAGSFGNVETAFTFDTGFTDVTADFNSTGSDVQMFVLNGHLVYIGMAAMFDEVEFILAVTASNAGIQPTFEYSDGASGWTPFSPTDNTNGMRQNGDLVWIASALSGWAQDTVNAVSGKFWIRITRGAVTVSTPPTEDLVQAASDIDFIWDSSGNLSVADVTVNDLVTFTETAGDATCAAGDFNIKGNSSTNKLRGCENGTLFDLNTAGGAGDITDVGPGCDTGACWTDGLATTGTVLLVWEGTGADANEFTINVPANPGADIGWTISDSATALTFPTGTTTVAAFSDNLGVFAATTSAEFLGIISNETGTTGLVVASINPTLTDVTVDDLITFTETAGDATCAAGDYWVKGNSTSNKMRGCENGTAFDLNTAGGGNSFGTIGNAVADTGADTLTVTDSGRIDFTTTNDPEDLTADIIADSLNATHIDETVAYAFSSTTNTFIGASYTDGSGAAAGAGVLRCANNVACVAAEAAPAGADGTILYNASEEWVFNSPISVSSGGTDQVQLGSGTNLSTWQHTFIEFEGSTDNAFETRFNITDPTADRFVTVPNADSTTVQPDTGAANNFLTAISAAGVISKAQPAFTDISGTASAAQIQEVIALADLTDVASTTGSGTVSVLGTNPTLTDVTIDDLITFTETAGDATCAVGDYWVKGNSTSNTMRGCENGNLFDVNTTAGAASWSSLTDPTGAVTMNSGAVAELLQFNYTAGYGATDVLFQIEQLTGNPLAGSILLELVAADTDILLLSAGSGANTIDITQAGAMTAEGTASITATDLAADAVDATTELAASLCGANTILERQASVWACIATPSGGGARWDELTDPTAAIALNSGTNTELFQMNFTSALGATDVAVQIEQLTGNPVAGSILLELVAADTDILLLSAGSGANTIDITQAGAMSAQGTASITATLGDSATGFFGAGEIEPVRGGTGQDSSGSTGVPEVAAGTWSFAANIADLASSTSAELLGVLSDGTGTASAVFANNPLFPVQVRFTAMAAPAYAAGNLFYDSTDQAVVFHNDEADIALQIGQEGWVRVRNETGVTITDGQVVYIDGIVSGLPSIALAKADAMSTARAVGFATHDIEHLSNGFVTLYGVVRDVNTTGLTDDVYLSATTAGGMVDSAPSDPNFVVPLGTIVETGATGDVFVNIVAPGPTGGAGVVVSGNSVAVDLLTADDQVGSTSNQSGLEFGDTGSDKLGLIRGCALNDILKFNTTGGLWECKVDNSGGSPTLDSIAAATGTSSINSGDNAIVWNWQLTTASKNAFEFTENVAGTATTDAVLVQIATLAASTVHPLEVTARGDVDGIRIGATDGILVELGSGGVDFGALLNYPTACSNQFIRAILDTPTCNTVGTADIAAGAADNTIIRDSAGFSVIGKSTTGSGDPADIVAADGTVLGRTAAGNLVFAALATDQVANQAITYTKIQNISATDRLLGRDTAGAGSAEELTVGGGVSFTGSGGIQCDAASTTAVGCPEMAINTEVDTGTSTVLAVTPDALAGSDLGQVEVQMTLFDFTTAVTTGDGKYFFHIAESSKLIGMDLISLTAAVVTVSSSGLPTVDVARCAPVATGNPCSGTVVDVLTTDLTIDVNEDSSFTATTAFAINTANDDVVEDGMWRIDVDTAGTGTQGLIVTLIFQKP